MEWQVSSAKNGEATLSLNGINIYSKYRPGDDVKRWIKAELNVAATNYILIGLGLGYHLKILRDLVKDKPITVLCFEKQEYKIFKSSYDEEWWQQSNIEIVYTLDSVEITDETQLLLPNAWLKALGEQHRFFQILETIKINQQSYKKFAPLMYDNFKQNTLEMNVASYPKKINEFACLVASGPSLDETVRWLKEISGKVDVYVVGSALKPLLKEDIIPKAVVISDVQDEILKQFEGVDYTGDLFYLSTANYKTVNAHRGPRFIMFQQGYNYAEAKAKELNYPMLKTGGSVSTITSSLIEYLGYKHLLLFGLDLGFTQRQTHTKHSPSDKTIEAIPKLNVLANDGTEIYTMPNLRVYLRWFESKFRDSTMNIYNTARQGAKISEVPFIEKNELFRILKLQGIDN